MKPPVFVKRTGRPSLLAGLGIATFNPNGKAITDAPKAKVKAPPAKAKKAAPKKRKAGKK